MQIKLENIEVIEIIDGNNGNTMEITERSNKKIFEYLINNITESKYKETGSSKGTGGYTYAISFRGKGNELRILILDEYNIEFQGYFYNSNKELEIERIKEAFENK